MSGDDETREEGSSEKDREDGEDAGAAHRVDEALARARAIVDKANASKKRDPGRWPAPLPLTVAILMLALMMPRATVPDAVPMPIIDERALGEVMRADDARAAQARTTRLPTDVLALGSAVRALQVVQQKEDPTENELQSAQAMLDEARRALGARSDWEDDVLVLRAAQMRAFLDELERYEATGTMSEDLEQLGGGFVRRVKAAGWSEGNRILLDDAQRRAIFKTVWNALAGVDSFDRFAPTLDEQRALYSLYIARPYPGELSQRTIDAMRRNASDAAECGRAAAEDRRARETWRADKIQKLGMIDPTYPTTFALGVAYYRAGRYDLSSDAFRAWLDAHPDGPLATRARNHLKAALDAYGAI